MEAAILRNVPFAATVRDVSEDDLPAEELSDNPAGRIC